MSENQGAGDPTNLGSMANTNAGFHGAQALDAGLSRSARRELDALEPNPIGMARKALFDAGGLGLVSSRIGCYGRKGRMVALAPEFAERAAAYNALADLQFGA